MRELARRLVPTSAALLVLAVGGCSYLPSPSLPSTAELDYRQMQRRLGEDRNERRRLTSDCIDATAARDAGVQNDIAAAMGVDRGEAPTAFCRRLIVGITRNRLTYQEFAALQNATAGPEVFRKLAEVVNDPGYAAEYGPLD